MFLIKFTEYLKLFFAYIFALLFHLPLDLPASDKDEGFFEMVWSDIGKGISDAEYIFSDGFAPDLNTVYLYTGIVGLTTLSVYEFDTEIYEHYFTGEEKPQSYHIVGYYGELHYFEAVSGAIYLAGILSGTEELRENGRLMIETLVLSGSITMLMRVAFGRTKPYLTETNLDFNWFSLEDDNHSFPPGHATVAFGMSRVLAEWADRWWASVCLYTLAATSSWTRLYYNQHWSADVLLGTAIGYFSADAVIQANKANKSDNNLSIQVNPFGIGFVYNF